MKNYFLILKSQMQEENLCKVKINNKLIYLIDESYNSNPLSLKFAIQNFDNYKVKKRKIFNFGRYA